METFDNIIPALAKAHYFKENTAAKDEGVVSYSNSDLASQLLLTSTMTRVTLFSHTVKVKSCRLNSNVLKSLTLTNMLTMFSLNLKTSITSHAPLSERYPSLTLSVQIARKRHLCLTLAPTS